MTTHSSNRSTLQIFGLAAFLITSLASMPATARPVLWAPERFDLETLLADPLGLAIGGTLLIAFIVGAWIVLRGAPLTGDIERKREEFLDALPANAEGFKAVLYRDEIQGQYSANPSPNHRIIVELVHGTPEKSKELYRNDVLPTFSWAEHRKASNDAITLWLETAAEQDLSAVCATRKGVQKLEPRHFAEFEKDPDRFLKTLRKRMLKNRRTPAK